MRCRVSKQPVARLASLADVIMSQRKGVKRVISEPLFNRLREKLHKIRRKRASSEPISLEAIRQRKYSLQNTTTFQVGQSLTTKFLKKGVSVDSGMDTNGKAVTLPPRPRLLSGGSSDHSTEGKVAVRQIIEEALSTTQEPPKPSEHNEDSRSAYFFLTELVVRTVFYGPEFFPVDLCIIQRENTRICNLQYVPRKQGLLIGRAEKKTFKF